MSIQSFIEPPWSDEQVANLSEYQTAGFFHPYTCPDCGSDLIATRLGWVCTQDDYKQRWAHGYSADRAWLDSMALMYGRLRSGIFNDE